MPGLSETPCPASLHVPLPAPRSPDPPERGVAACRGASWETGWPACSGSGRAAPELPSLPWSPFDGTTFCFSARSGPERPSAKAVVSCAAYGTWLLLLPASPLRLPSGPRCLGPWNRSCEVAGTGLKARETCVCLPLLWLPSRVALATQLSRSEPGAPFRKPLRGIRPVENSERLAPQPVWKVNTKKRLGKY